MANFSRNPGAYPSSDTDHDQQSNFQQYLNNFDRDGTQPQVHSAGTWPQDSSHKPAMSERTHETAGDDQSHTRPATSTSGRADESVNNSTTQLTPPAVPTVQVTAILPNPPPASVQLLPPANAGPLVEKRKPTLKKVLLNWKWEIVAAVLAIGILVCEIILLVHYDHKFLFIHWSHDWKINSVFAFLTTILEASITFFVAACIGQLRWHWYRKNQHRLDWLEIMTDAQRPSGAMRLLFRKGSHKQFAIFGALIIIFLLGVSTFTQQVITSVIKPFPLGFGNGVVPINTNYTWRDTDTTIRVGTQQPLPDMVAAIQDGFYSFSTVGGSQSVEAWTACYGDSCDFGQYQSIGVCSRCADISKSVDNPCPTGNCTSSDYYTFKNGSDLSLLTTNGILNLTADTDLPMNPDLQSEVGPLLVRFHALVANHAGNNQSTGASATECAAWWCVKTYNGTIVNGTLHEDIIDHWTDKSPSARTHYRQPNDIILRPPQCFVNGTKPTNESFCEFHASAFSQNALQNFLAAPDESLPFNAFLSGSTVFYNHPEGSTFNSTSLLALGLVSATSVRRAIMEQIHFGFHKMAEQMTVSIRGALTQTYGSEYSYGKAFWRQQQFHVRWGWIAYPIVIVAAALVFLITTIWMTKKDEAWKASILPVIYHSFGGVDRDEFVKLDTVQDMKKASRNRKVSLAVNQGHAAFKAGKHVRQHGRLYEMTQTMAGGAGKAGEIVGPVL